MGNSPPPLRSRLECMSLSVNYFSDGDLLHGGDYHDISMEAKWPWVSIVSLARPFSLLTVSCTWCSRREKEKRAMKRGHVSSWNFFGIA